MVHAARHSNALNDQKLFKGNREPSAKNNAAKIIPISTECLECIRQRAFQLALNRVWLHTQALQEVEPESRLQVEDYYEQEVMLLLFEDDELDDAQRENSNTSM